MILPNLFEEGTGMLRLLKVMIVLIIGLHSLFYALQNIANFYGAHGTMFSLGYVLSGVDHVHYPKTMFFYSSNPVLTMGAAVLVVIAELAVGFFGLKGAYDMFAARHASLEQFRNSMWSGQVAAAFALLTWFGLFMTGGGAFFEMWQTQIGRGTVDLACKFASISAIAMLFVYNTPDGPSH